MQMNKMEGHEGLLKKLFIYQVFRFWFFVQIMEGTILVASTFDKDRQWHKLFVKLDDISAQLLCFKVPLRALVRVFTPGNA